MAANVIKVSTEAMNGCIARYTAQKAKLLDALQICIRASQLLAQSWAGPSFVACTIKLANTYKNLFQSEQKINDAISELRATINNMEGAENKVKGAVTALDTGTSPFS